MKTRIYFLDNLRTMMILLVVLLHAGIVYEPILVNSWIVSDPEKINSLGLLRMYLDIFVMFTLFYISGYFIPFSIRDKSALTFIKSKFKRILLPWTLAVLTLIPAYKFIFLGSRGMHQEEWFSYFHFFARSGGDLSSFADNPVQNWLWFLPVLFLFQIAYFFLSKTKLSTIKPSVFKSLLIIVLAGLAYSMVISEMGLRGWYHSVLLHFQRERLLLYFLVFLLGAYSAKKDLLSSSFIGKRNYIISSVVLSICLGVFTVTALNLFFNMIDPARNYFFISSLADRMLYYSSLSLSMLSMLFILIYHFKISLNRTSPLLRMLSANSYTVYIIHMIVLGLIAWALLLVEIPVIVKYLVLSVMTFAFSNLIAWAFQGCIHDFKPVRMLAGISALALLLILIGSQKPQMNKEKTMTSAEILPADSIPEISLHEAAYFGKLEVIKKHIQEGSNLNEKDPQGNTPLIISILFGKTEATKLLIDAGAGLDITNADGSTALHVAAFFCHPEIVKELLRNGADPGIRNHSGSTALESVAAPFEMVRGVYDHLAKTLGPMGLELDYSELQKLRPEVAKILLKASYK